MTSGPGLRRFTLTAHVVCSVGWLGAVGAFLALALIGLNSGDGAGVRAAYLSMERIGWLVIVPLSLAALVTGLVQSLGTHWGLFRHYWVIVKLAINVIATAVLLIHMQPIEQVADVASERTLGPADLRDVRLQLVADAGFALVALMVATVFSIYKPRGLTRHGWRTRQRDDV